MAFNFDLNKVKWVKGYYDLPEAIYKIKTPSVSTILGEMIPDPSWDEFVAKVGQEKADAIMTAAGNRGSSMHIFIQNFITNLVKSKDVSAALRYTQEESPKILRAEKIPQDKIEEGMNFFYKFYYSDYPNQYLDMLAMEMGIYSKRFFYRGKLDILYKDKIFGLSLTDFKSSNGKIKKDSVKEIKYLNQLGAYANCIDEMYEDKGIKCTRASILCVDKQSDILQEVECSGALLEKYKESFRTFAKEWHIKNNQEYLMS